MIKTIKKKFELECDICGAVSLCTINDLTCKKPECGYHHKPNDDLIQNLFGKLADRVVVSQARQSGLHLLTTNPVLPVALMGAEVLDESKWNWRYDSVNQLWIPPDYAKTKTTDMLFIIKKASQGLWDEPTWEQGQELILLNEISLGGYHYADVAFDAIQAARKFATQANAVPSEKIWGTDVFPQWWLDCESNRGSGTVTYTRAQMEQYFYTFTQEFQNQTGQPIGIYTREIWWNDYVARNAWAHVLGLWIARYNNYIPEPGEPLDWSNYGEKPVLWQWSADGNGEGFKYGYQSNSVDKNRSPILTDEQILNIVGSIIAPPISGLPFELDITDPATGEQKLYRQVI